MKKEHWLYLIIAILAIWLIASYANRSRTPDTDLSNEDALSNESESLASADGAAVPTGDSESNTSVQSSPLSIAQVGLSAGPNKGVVVSAVVPTSARVTVADQPAGSIVAIGAVDMTVDGWVVVHEPARTTVQSGGDRAGAPGNILGAQRFDAGSYSGGQVELLRTTVAGGKYYVMLHMDNGDRMFDKNTDTPIMSGSEMVMATFMAQ